MPRQTGRKLIATNKRAQHDFTILKTYEAGIVLSGTEVKSARAGRVSIVEAFAQERDGEIVLHGLHVAEYSHGNRANHQRTLFGQFDGQAVEVAGRAGRR